jgi:hypothetical protein
LKVLRLPDDFEHLSEPARLAAVRRRVRERYQKTGGRYSGFGEILRYRRYVKRPTACASSPAKTANVRSGSTPSGTTTSDQRCNRWGGVGHVPNPPTKRSNPLERSWRGRHHRRSTMRPQRRHKNVYTKIGIERQHSPWQT